MAVLLVGYRATVYAPRSAQADPNVETTVLTPRAGGLHTDPFQITTLAGVAGWLPYLALPSGRKGRIDFRAKKTDTGSMSLTAIDPRVDEGEGNAGRWLTQFYGDAGARSAMARCRVFVEETLDGGLTWHPYFTGRVDDVKQKERLEFTLTLKDLNDDLTQEIFLNDPAADLTYARRGPIHPYALTEDFGDLDANRDKMLAATDDSVAPSYRLGLTTDNTNAINWRKITAELKGLATSIRRRIVSATAGSAGIREEMTFTQGTLKARVDRFDTDARIGDFWVVQINSVISEGQWTPRWYYLVRDVAALGSPAFPADNFQVHFDVCATGPAREYAPILIDDVHPATFLRDLFAGKFGILNLDGSPRYPVEIDEASFAALEADVSFPLIRSVITEAGKLRDFAQEQVCQPTQIAYYVNALGQIGLIDMRRASGVGTSLELTDADLVAESGAALASQVSGDAITHVVVKLRKYQILDPIEDAIVGDQADRYPSVPGAGLALTDYEEEYFALGDVRTLDFNAKPTELNLQGVTAGVLTTSDVVQIGRLPFYRRRTVQEKVVDDLFAMFSHGGNYFTLRCRRTGTAETVDVGTRVIATISALANALTNVRGGSRLGVCIERSEDASVVTLSFADLGSTEIADPPELGTPTVDGVNCADVIHLPVTLNAAGDPVRVDVAVVAIGDPQPAETSALWEFKGIVLATTADFTISGLEPNSDIYIRARSDPRGATLALPSEWVFPTPDHVTTCPGPTDVVDGPAVAALFCLVPSHTDVGVQASDTRYRIEVERSDDEAGTGATVITGPTGVVGTTTTVHDEEADGVAKWYRARLLFEDGTPAGEYTARIQCTSSVGTPPDPDPVLPLITDFPTQTPADVPTEGQLLTVIFDPQLRVIDVSFKHRAGGTAETAFAIDASVPYTDAVAIVANAESTITRLVRYTGGDGTIVEDEKTFVYPLVIPEPPPLEPDAVAGYFQTVLHASYTEAANIGGGDEPVPIASIGDTELSGIGRRGVDAAGSAKVKIWYDVEIPGPPGCVGLIQYVDASIENPAEEDWQNLNLDDDGPTFPLDVETFVPRETTAQFLALGARQSIVVRAIGRNGDDASAVLVRSIVLGWYGGSSVEQPPTEPVPPGPCEESGGLTEGFEGYVNDADLLADWVLDSLWPSASVHLDLTGGRDGGKCLRMDNTGGGSALGPRARRTLTDLVPAAGNITFQGWYRKNVPACVGGYETGPQVGAVRNEDGSSARAVALDSDDWVFFDTADAGSATFTDGIAIIAVGWGIVSFGAACPGSIYFDDLAIKINGVLFPICGGSGGGVPPEPDPGPVVPPAPPATGIRALELAHYVERYVGDYPAFNGSSSHFAPSELIAILNTYRSRGWRLILIPWTEGNVVVNGVFSQSRYLAQVAEYAALDLSTYTDVLVGIYVIDEPQLQIRWGPGGIQWAVVDGVLAKKCREVFPGYAAMIRVAPTQIESWTRVQPVYVTTGWAQYLAVRGDLTTYMRANRASAVRLGISILWGLNYRNGGTPNSTPMTPTQIVSFGVPMAQDANSYGINVWSNIWEVATNADLRSSAVEAAFATVLAAMVQP